MKLQFGDKIIDVRAEKTGELVSNSTGRQLASYLIYFDVKGKKALETCTELANKYKEENLIELDELNRLLRTFRVSNFSYNYNGASDDESTIYNYSIDIIEYEELFASVITIAGIDCEVLKYEERIDRETDAIIIDAIIKQTEEDRAKISANIEEDKYFDVVRKEISDKVLKMRFGQVIWSKHDSFIKRNVILVEESYDDQNKNIHGFNEPQISNIEKLLAQQLRYSALLEELMISKDIIAPVEISRIREEVENSYRDIYRDYYLVDDVEEY